VLSRVAATVPGVGYVDAAGRHGVGVSVADNSDGDSITLIFDRNTYQYLGMTGADHLGRSESTALLASGLVNQEGQTS
jgi:hypothetical protein